jgi:hypothetical protein
MSIPCFSVVKYELISASLVFPLLFFSVLPLLEFGYFLKPTPRHFLYQVLRHIVKQVLIKAAVLFAAPAYDYLVIGRR